MLGLLKPPGPTSQQVVGWLRARLPRGWRVGHAGTLDPGAAGVLAVCLGPACRLADYLHLPPKTYRCELVLGVETDTQDSAGRPGPPTDTTRLQASEVSAVLASLCGESRLPVPAFSARHYRGERLYAYARRGEPVPLPLAAVTVHRFELLDWQPGPMARARCAIVCSAGTYVRSLCAEAGRRLGVGGHMGALIRTGAAGLDVSSCWTLEEIAVALQHGTLARHLLTPATALSFLPLRMVDPSEADGIRYGRAPGRQRAAATDRDGPVRLVDDDGRLLAVARRTCTQGVCAWTLERVLVQPPR